MVETMLERSRGGAFALYFRSHRLALGSLTLPSPRICYSRDLLDDHEVTPSSFYDQPGKKRELQ